MAHFAELGTDNIVLRVMVVSNEDTYDEFGVEHESRGIKVLEDLFGGTWVQTSYNDTIRKQNAGEGFKYDSVNDIFIAPKPYPSWTIDSNYDWQAPVAYPADPNIPPFYYWDETDQEWKGE